MKAVEPDRSYTRPQSLSQANAVPLVGSLCQWMPLRMVPRAVWSTVAQACIILQTLRTSLFCQTVFCGESEEFGFFEGILDVFVLVKGGIIRLNHNPQDMLDGD